jgi:hypothetical protein
MDLRLGLTVQLTGTLCFSPLLEGLEPISKASFAVPRCRCDDMVADIEMASLGGRQQELQDARRDPAAGPIRVGECSMPAGEWKTERAEIITVFQ